MPRRDAYRFVFAAAGAFTPVCTTEFMTFASMAGEFAAINCSLLGLSIDSNPSHIAWSRAIEKYQWKDIKNPKITFPIIADDLGMVAKLYGMLMPSASSTRTVRTVFFIDPEGTIRAILLYPLTTGRNMKEIMRILLALQAYDKTGYATPADWMPGESQVMPAPQTMDLATKRLDEQKAGGYYCLDWYLCFTKGTNAPVMPQPAVKAASAPVPAPAPAPMASMVTPVSASEAANSGSGMAEIMDMLGAAGMMPPNVKMPVPEKSPAPIAPKPMNPPAAPVAPKPMNPPVSSAPMMRQPMQQPKFEGGIMEQNRMLFEGDNRIGLGNDYMITRDYPNLGA